MKFVGHCLAVLKSFSTNYASFITVLKEINTHKTEGLLKIILDLGFVVDYLFMKDVLYYLTICSKTVQKAHHYHGYIQMLFPVPYRRCIFFCKNRIGPVLAVSDP